MKKLFTILLIIAINSTFYSQVLKENKIDEFLKLEVKTTSWEQLTSKSARNLIYFRICKSDNNYFFDFKFINRDVFSVSENDVLMLKFDNDNIYSLYCIKSSTTTIGGGAIGFWGSQAYGINVTYQSNQDKELTLLSKHKVTKIRFYKSNGFVEEDIKPQYAQKIINAINLVNTH